MDLEHKGQHLSAWISDAQMEKVKSLAISAGVTKTEVIRALIDGRALPERSYWKTYSTLASIGGLIKARVESGQHGSAYSLGCEILKIAHQLRDGHHDDGIGD